MKSPKAWQPLEDKKFRTDISVSEAEEIINEFPFKPTVVSVSLQDSLGKVIADDVLADRDFPPFNRVAMDGICIRFSDWQKNGSRFSLKGIQAAGSAQLNLAEGRNALEVMTGAVLPKNADTVIRYEDVTMNQSEVVVNIENIRKGMNVHNQGNDQKKGDVLIPAGTMISAAEIGILATVGKSTVRTLSHPKVAIVSTGDELVDVDSIPLPHQIRKSNVHVLEAILQKHGITPTLVHLTDDPQSMQDSLTKLLNRHDTILLSGAVSKGKYDYLPEVLNSIGVTTHFHRVQQRPGKPFWFGSRDNVTVFAFPGNPVSTTVCMVRYFVPWLKKSLNQPLQPVYAALNSELNFKPALQYFVPVSLKFDKNMLIATPEPGNGSGDLANLRRAQAFIELPADKESHQAGDSFPVWYW